MSWRDAEREYADEVVGETTIPVLFEDSAARHRDRPAQRYKGGVYERSLVDASVLPPAPDGEFRSIDYGRLRNVVRKLAAGFRDLGVEAGDRVGIFCDTRMEWAQADLGLLAAGAVVTTIYPGSSTDQVRYLLSDPGATGVVVENEDLLSRVLAVEDDLDLEWVAVVDRATGDAADRSDAHSLADVYRRGASAFEREAYESWLDERDLDDLASLIYTSGTTGRPKGVQLTHRNLRSNVNQVRKRYGPRPDKGDTPVIDETTRVVSYLPLAHVFERLAGHFLVFASGASVAYAESPDTLQADFQAVKPTSATSVPRVYEKMYDAIRDQAEASAVGERLFAWATGVGERCRRADDPGPLLSGQRLLADKLVFRRVRAGLGGEIEFLISGGGSLSADLCGLYHCMGLPVLEGYGLTETSPVVSANPPEEPKVGTIGPPLPGVDVRVDESVVPPDAFRDAEGDVGELLVRGPNVTDGYWNMPEETAAAFEERPAAASSGDGAGGAIAAAGSDGATERWFRTGDVVEVRPDGYLVFREREKEILVLSTGKNVPPEPIEDAFSTSDVVDQSVVLGDGEKFVSALLVPDFEGLGDWARREGVDLPGGREALVRDERVRERVEAEVDRVNERFEPHETIKEFRLVPEVFTEENGLLTPTMKKKRREIAARYADEIADIYAEEPAAEAE